VGVDSGEVLMMVRVQFFLSRGKWRRGGSNEAKWLGQVLVCLWRCVVCSWIGVHDLLGKGRCGGR